MLNNKTKMFLLFSMVLITMIGMTAISASDVDDTISDTQISDASNHVVDTIGESNAIDNNKQVEKTSEKNLKDDGEGTFTELQSVVDSAESEIPLDKDYVRESTESNVTIAKDIIIDGQGHTINLNQQNIAFEITGNVTLKNLIICNSINTEGLFCTPISLMGGELTLVNVTFENNTSPSYGSGGVGTVAGTTLNVINSTFRNLSAPYGAIYLSARATLNVENTQFIGINSTNSVVRMGGANSNYSYKNCLFQDNYCTSTSTGTTAALYLSARPSRLIIINTTFKNNNAMDPPALYISSTNTNVSIYNSTFVENNLRRVGADGGVIYVNGMVYLENNIIQNNTANTQNTIYYYGGDLSKIYVACENASYDEGSNIVLRANVTDDNGNLITGGRITFTFNEKNYSASVTKGVATTTVSALPEESGYYPLTAVAGHTSSENQVVTNATILYGTVLPAMTDYTSLQSVIDEQENGATIKLNNNIARAETETKVVINKDLTIDGKNLTIDASQGAMFEITNNAVVTIKNVVLTNGLTENLVNITSGNVVLSNVVIDNSTVVNTYNQYGLLSVKSGSSLTIDNSKINNIKGVVIDNMAQTTINNTTITNCDSQGNGNQPSIMLEKGNLTILNSEISNNRGYSGIIYSTSPAMRVTAMNGTLTVDNTKFINNTITQGNAVISANNKTTINGSIFENNKATRTSGANGSALAISYDVMNVTNTIFVNNTATGDVSTAYAGLNGKLDISNSILLSDDNKPLVTVTSTSGSAILNNNYWGTNANPTSSSSNKVVTQIEEEDYWGDVELTNLNVTLDNWVIINTTLTENPEDNSEFSLETKAALIDTNDAVTDLTQNLPDYLEITFTATAGSFDDDVLSLENNQATNNYHAGLEDSTLTISVPNQEQTFDITAPEIDPKNYKGLQKIIDATNDQTLELIKDCTRGESENNITISNKNIVIDGKGYTIDENGGRLFIIENSNVTLKNLIIKNAGTYSPSVIQIWSGNLVMENVTIINSTSSSDGALVYIGDGATATINNVTFDDNTARFISNVGTTVLNNSIIKNTNANTSSMNYWGYNNGNLTVENTIFENNTGYSSGIYTGTSSSAATALNNVTFKDNIISSASSSGGLIYSQVPLTINNSLFENNILVGSSSFNGLIYVKKNTIVDNSVFVDNKLNYTGTSTSATIKGGVFYISGNSQTTLNITKSTFIHNTGARNGTVIYNFFGVFNVSNSVFINNYDDVVIPSVYNYDTASYADNNWWGTNENIREHVQEQSSRYPLQTDTWVIMNATSQQEGNTFTITTTFNKVMDANGNIADLVGSLPDGLEVTYTTSAGELAADTTTVVNGITTNTLTSDATPEITVTQANQVIVLNGEEKPEFVIITDETYPNYFDETGVPLPTLEGISEIRLSGEFNNRLFTLTEAVNLTTDEVQAVLKDSTIYLTTGVEGTNVTNLIINNTDYDEQAIYIGYTNNIRLINNTIIQNNSDVQSKAIVIEKSDNLVIDSNEINVIGPSIKISYYGSAMWGFANTSAIQTYGSNNMQITNNNVSVKASKLLDPSEIVDTITAIQFSGDIDWSTFDLLYSNENVVSNNNIYMEGIGYAYAIRLTGYNNENTISNNIITTSAKNAYGVDIGGPSDENTINNNTITVNASEISYAVILSTNTMGNVNYNEITNNTINAIGNNAYGIEFYQGDENTISNNNINVEGNFTIGIGLYMADENTITNNNITATGDSSATPTVTTDVVLPEVAGIVFSNGSSHDKVSDDNTITGNIIRVTDAAATEAKYTVILSGSGNEVTNNTLYGTKVVGDASVYGAEENTVENNLPEPLTATITVEDVTGFINQPTTITAVLIDSIGANINEGIVAFVDLDGNILATSEVVDGQATAELTFKEIQNQTLTAIFTNSETYDTVYTTFELSIKKPETTITINEFTATPGQQCNISATVLDEAGNAVNVGKVVFKVNGQTLKDANGKVIYAKVVNGTATIENYEIPESWEGKELNISAVYSGSSNYESSKVENVAINITPSEPVFKLEPITGEVKLGTQVTLRASLTGTAVPLNAGKVIFKLNGKTLKDANGKVIYANMVNGTVTVDYTFNDIKAKEYTLTAAFIHSDYERMEDSVNVTITE